MYVFVCNKNFNKTSTLEIRVYSGAQIFGTVMDLSVSKGCLHAAHGGCL